jgi:heptosyltransferase-1
MGDVIHALPLAENAHRAGAEVAWLVERPFAGLLEDNPHCAEILVADTKRWRRRPSLGALSTLRRKILGFRPDLAIDAQGLWKSAIAARASNATVTGFSARERREPASALLCGIQVTPDPAAPHVVDRNLALLEAAGIPVATRAPDARFLLSRESPAAASFLAGVPRPFFVVHPGAARAEKAWGEERFAALARGLRRERGLTPVVSWGPGDEKRVEKMRGLLPEAPVAPALDFAGLAHVARASALFAAGDTGPVHLADAVGSPTLALFGPTDPERNGPYRDRRGIVTSMTSVADEAVLGRALMILGREELPL